MRPRHRRIAETRIRGSNTLVRRGSEALPATLAQREFVHLDQTHDGNGRDHELGDPHPGLDGERVVPIAVQENDADLTAIAGVDQPRRVQDADPVTGRESRSRQHEAGMTRGDLDRDSRRDGGPLTGAEIGRASCRERVLTDV